MKKSKSKDFERVPDKDIPWLPNGVVINGVHHPVAELDKVFGRDNLGLWLFNTLLSEHVRDVEQG